MTVWGSSAGGRNSLNGLQEWERINGVIEGYNGGYPMQARRTYSQTMESNIYSTSASGDIGNRAIAHSIRAGDGGSALWQATMSGSHDANIRSLVQSIPDDQIVWLCYSHEPEDEGGNPAYFKAACARFIQLVLDEGKPNVVPTFNLMAFTWRTSTRDPDDWNPGTLLTAGERAASMGAIDGYGGTNPAVRTPDWTYTSTYNTIVNSWGFRYGLFEVGVNAGVSGRATWMLQLEDWVTARDVDVVCWWHSGGEVDQFWIDGTNVGDEPTTTETWAGIIGRNQGADIPDVPPPDVTVPDPTGTGGGVGSGGGIGSSDTILTSATKVGIFKFSDWTDPFNPYPDENLPFLHVGTIDPAGMTVAEATDECLDLLLGAPDTGDGHDLPESALEAIHRVVTGGYDDGATSKTIIWLSDTLSVTPWDSVPAVGSVITATASDGSFSLDTSWLDDTYADARGRWAPRGGTDDDWGDVFGQYSAPADAVTFPLAASAIAASGYRFMSVFTNAAFQGPWPDAFYAHQPTPADLASLRPGDGGWPEDFGAVMARITGTYRVGGPTSDTLAVFGQQVEGETTLSAVEGPYDEWVIEQIQATYSQGVTGTQFIAIVVDGSGSFVGAGFNEIFQILLAILSASAEAGYGWGLPVSG